MDQFGNRQYDWKIIKRYFWIMVATILLWMVTKGVGAVVVTAFVIMAVLRDKPIELMFWVIYMTFSSSGNRSIFVTNVTSLLIVRGTLLLLTLMLAARLFRGGREAKLITPFWGIMFYLLWECVVSANGFQPVVSYMKLFLFFNVFLAMFGVANTVNSSTRANAKILRSMLLSVFAFILIGSVLLIPFPGIGMMSDKADIERMLAGEVTSLFMGMTSHSQNLGTIAALIAVFLFGDMAFSIKRWDRFYLLLLLCCPVLVYKSSCRTGMGAMIAGLGVVMFFVIKARGMGKRWKGKLMMAVNLIIVIGMVGVVALPAFRNKVGKFVLKYNMSEGAKVTMEEVLSTRQAKLDGAMENFKKKPWTGNGFQVSEEMQYQKRDSIMDYISAPVEKSTWTYAILEEGGIIGMVLFCCWLIVLFCLLIQRHAYIGASVFFAFIVVNLGEFSIFSMSHTGGLYWTLVFAAICLDVQRMKSSNMPVFFVPIEEVFEEVGYDAWTRRQG